MASRRDDSEGGDGAPAVVVVGGGARDDEVVTVSLSSINAALQRGGFGDVQSRVSVERLSKAMVDVGYCAIKVDDAIMAHSIRAHLDQMKRLLSGGGWGERLGRRLPGEQQGQGVPPPRYHGYHKAQNGKEVADLRMRASEEEEEDAYSCLLLPTGRGAFVAMDGVARTVVRVVCKALGLKDHNSRTSYLTPTRLTLPLETLSLKDWRPCPYSAIREASLVWRQESQALYLPCVCYVEVEEKDGWAIGKNQIHHLDLKQ